MTLETIFTRGATQMEQMCVKPAFRVKRVSHLSAGALVGGAMPKPATAGVGNPRRSCASRT
jgi:hypothetical protein